MVRVLISLLFAALLPVVVTAQGLDLTASERAAFQALGPWPVPRSSDPSNDWSGDADAIALGRRLFADRRLSQDWARSCADCHRPDLGYADGLRLGQGREPLDLHTTTLTNLPLMDRFGWHGERDTLWQQSLRPLQSAAEMALSAGELRRRVIAAQDLGPAYAAVFGDARGQSADEVFEHVGKALAAYQETLVTPITPFDRFWFGEDTNYPQDARRGLKVFLGQGGCVACHSGPNFSDSALHAGIRTPSLRNVAQTAPYLHDGRAGTLSEVIARYDRGLSDNQTADLIAFLRSLDGAPTAR